MHFLFRFVVVAQVNLALGRPASQSSTYGTYVASKAVDGESVDELSCSITGIGDYQPWWKVELANVSWITHVEITNKRDSGEYEQLHFNINWNIHTMKPEVYSRYLCRQRYQKHCHERMFARCLSDTWTCPTVDKDVAWLFWASLL